MWIFVFILVLVSKVALGEDLCFETPVKVCNQTGLLEQRFPKTAREFKNLCRILSSAVECSGNYDKICSQQLGNERPFKAFEKPGNYEMLHNVVTEACDEHSQLHKDISENIACISKVKRNFRIWCGKDRLLDAHDDYLASGSVPRRNSFALITRRERNCLFYIQENSCATAEITKQCSAAGANALLEVTRRAQFSKSDSCPEVILSTIPTLISRFNIEDSEKAHVLNVMNILFEKTDDEHTTSAPPEIPDRTFSTAHYTTETETKSPEVIEALQDDSQIFGDFIAEELRQLSSDFMRKRAKLEFELKLIETTEDIWHPDTENNTAASIEDSQIYGNLIANELRKLSHQDLQRKAKLAIQETLVAIEEEDLWRENREVIESSRDGAKIFGNFVASEIRQLNTDLLQRKATLKIQQVLMKRVGDERAIPDPDKDLETTRDEAQLFGEFTADQLRLMNSDFLLRKTKLAIQEVLIGITTTDIMQPNTEGVEGFSLDDALRFGNFITNELEQLNSNFMRRIAKRKIKEAFLEISGEKNRPSETERMTEAQDEDDKEFGNFITSELRKLSSDFMKRRAKLKILQVLVHVQEKDIYGQK